MPLVTIVACDRRPGTSRAVSSRDHGRADVLVARDVECGSLLPLHLPAPCRWMLPPANTLKPERKQACALHINIKIGRLYNRRGAFSLTVGANLRVRPYVEGRHIGLRLPLSRILGEENARFSRVCINRERIVGAGAGSDRRTAGNADAPHARCREDRSHRRMYTAPTERSAPYPTNRLTNSEKSLFVPDVPLFLFISGASRRQFLSGIPFYCSSSAICLSRSTFWRSCSWRRLKASGRSM